MSGELTKVVQPLIKWFIQHKRPLPFRDTTDPYHIWISEVMLQQTQVKTVITYFEKWIKLFPTIDSLASASTTDVIKAWEGLGYYSRARNLQNGAKELVKNYNSKLPDKKEELLKIKGIGPYTSGAILNFAFRKKATLIDGNVKRVFSRLLRLDLDFSKEKSHNELSKIIYDILPQDEFWIFNEALMELGALVCKPKTPLCPLCPLKEHCMAFKKSDVLNYPKKIQREKTIKLYRLVFIFEHENQILIKKNNSNLMQDLFEFPFVELESFYNESDLKKALNMHLKTTPISSKALKKITHSFTRYRATLFPFHIKLDEKISWDNHSWFKKNDAFEKPFSAGHRKIKHQLNLT